jgi:acetolactate synthase-1/2/3 large subunit
MHFVAALDRHPDMRCVLCLFEGGATGAADGYYRMRRDIAATLLHLGPGLANGLANLHNARKAGSGVLNIVGDHTEWHLAHDSPLRGDLEGVSRAVSHWTRVSPDAPSVAIDGAEAIRAARSGNGRIATLILRAHAAWEEAAGPAPVHAPPTPRRPDAALVIAAARALAKPGAALLIDGPALHGPLAETAGRIAAKTGCRLIAPFLVSRIARGAGTVRIERLRYVVEDNVAFLADTTHIVLCGALRPVSFFSYPGQPSLPEPPGCPILDLCAPDMDIAWTLDALATETGATAIAPVRMPLSLPESPIGRTTLDMAGAALAALLPENAIVVDESVTCSRPLNIPTETARPSDWLHCTGGAIGVGLPCATGAALACPDRRTIALMGDGSAMYTLQSLWTMARENLNVLTIVFANRGYQILRGELANVGVDSYGRNAARMFDVENPSLDWVALAKGHGVAATRATDMDEFTTALRAGLAAEGPCLIELVC